MVRFYNFLPEGNPFLDNVLAGFSRLPRANFTRVFPR